MSKATLINSFKINGYVFRVYERNQNTEMNTFFVRCSDGDEIVTLEDPECEYETESGVHLGILMFLEKRS